MSIARRRILVVSDTLGLANNLLMWLNDAGYEPAIVTTFGAAKEHLRSAPDIVITELKLREYNGLHLALRAHRDGIPTAVIGCDLRHADDAQEMGARCVMGDNVHRDDILLLVDGLLSAASQRPAARGWGLNDASSGPEPLSGGGGEWARTSADATPGTDEWPLGTEPARPSAGRSRVH